VIRMRILAVFVGLLVLSGCGIARQQEAQDRLNKASADTHAATEACDQSFPKQQNLAVKRARCIADATAPMRQVIAYPDLYDQETANRNLLAERWQAGKITQAEYEAQFFQMHSQIMAEFQRRNLANRAIGAQELAASAAASPVICTHVGTSTICN
jgi:hypothetical protein